MFQWNDPVDPECPEVQEYQSELCDDPMTTAMGAPVGELTELWERQHKRSCSRCQQFGLANIEVVSAGD